MATSGVVFNPGAIQPRQQRKFNEKRHMFTGTDISHIGERDTGLPWIELCRFLAEQLATVAYGSCSHVLDRTKRDRLSQKLITVYRKEIKRIGRLPPPVGAAGDRSAYRAELTSAATYTTALSKNELAVNKLNAEAAVAINLIRECVNATVELVLDQAITLRTVDGIVDSEKALHSFLYAGNRLYISTASNLKRQLMLRFDTTGIAADLPGLQLLMATYAYFKALATEVLHVSAGVLRDPAVADFNDTELLEKLLARMSSDKSKLTQYRSMVNTGLAKAPVTRFTVVLTSISGRITVDMPSIDINAEAIHAHHAGSARAYHAALETDTAATYAANVAIGHAFVAAYGDYANKRSRVEPAHGEAGLQHAGAAAPGAPGPAVGATRCHYWDGTTCNFEAQMNRPCMYYAGHVPGVSTRTKDYVPKPKDGAPAGVPHVGPTIEQLRAMAPAIYEALTGSSTTGGAPSSTGHGYPAAPPFGGGRGGPYYHA